MRRLSRHNTTNRTITYLSAIPVHYPLIFPYLPPISSPNSRPFCSSSLRNLLPVSLIPPTYLFPSKSNETMETLIPRHPQRAAVLFSALHTSRCEDSAHQPRLTRYYERIKSSRVFNCCRYTCAARCIRRVAVLEDVHSCADCDPRNLEYIGEMLFCSVLATRN